MEIIKTASLAAEVGFTFGGCTLCWCCNGNALHRQVSLKAFLILSTSLTDEGAKGYMMWFHDSSYVSQIN